MHTGSAPCKQTKEMGLKHTLPSLLSEETKPVDTLTLDFQSPESGDNILLLFKSLDSWYFFFLTAADSKNHPFYVLTTSLLEGEVLTIGPLGKSLEKILDNL